jgi:hypothetical protein
VPLCAAFVPDGCITYPAGFASLEGLRADFTFGGVVGGAQRFYQVAAGIVQPLVLNIGLGVGPPPTADPNTTPVLINPVISSPGTLFGSVPLSPVLGAVTGRVTNFNANTTVTAEAAGTDQIIATTHLLGDGTLAFTLPALPAPGKLYDFYVSGSGSFVVRSHVAVTQGSTTPLGILEVTSSAFGSITGTINDFCPPNAAIQGAILKLLVPDTTLPGSATTCEPTGELPAIPPNCVVVATAATDDQGHYPLQFTTTPFSSIPVSPPPGVPHYDLEISAPGDNTAIQEVAAGSLLCGGSTVANTCSFSLEHGYLNGTAVLSSPNGTGNRQDVMIVAEDSGTDIIENSALTAIQAGASSGGFTMAVPIAVNASSSPNAIGVNDYDVFTTVQDLFEGFPQKTSGHLIGTAAKVAAPLSACSISTVPAISPMDCAGLGSVEGSVTGANPSTTSVRLSKDGVQIMETEQNSIGSATKNSYNFCAPSDDYTLTHFETVIPKSTVPITLAPPVSVAPPCSSICLSAAGTCLLCQPTTAPTLP